MKKICWFLMLVVTVVLILPGIGRATIINPYPTVFAPDDGSQLFMPDAYVISIEAFDLAGSLGFPSSFGFFYDSAPSTPIVIFGPEDQGTGLSQSAIIDFAAGTVYDKDESVAAGHQVVQSTFTNSGTPIGFFLWFNPSPYGSPLYLTTVPSFNPGGYDAAETFPLKTNPSVYLIGFELPNGKLLSFDITGGITPVPEPSTLLLLGSGLTGLAVYGRKRIRRGVRGNT